MMGDPTHLEKMGRELKCPICLSLLNSAVSLTCNHVFCNSCIVKSMKSGYDCPVCKVPYHRREIRAAPHMDNLVSIYKIMEIASGFNIFLTQNPPPLTKLPDEQKQEGGDTNGGRAGIDWICQDTLDEQIESSKQKESRKLDNPITSKPSFPTKKRVQLPRCSLSDTLTQPEKLRAGSGENKKGGFENDSAVLRKNPVVDEKGEPMLAPFFWLRDEDGEKSSQHTDMDQLWDITPPSVPTFSDIKDSDDENPSQSSLNGALRGKSNVADFFDSEMFEWTQRPCSPEIFSSPAKMQAEKTTEIDGIRESKSEAPPLSANVNEEHSDDSKQHINFKPLMGSEDTPANLYAPTVKNADNQIGRIISKKRGRNAKDTALRKCPRKNSDNDFEVTDAAERLSGKTTVKALANKGQFLILGGIGKWNKKDVALKGENVSSVSVRETLDLGDENTVSDQLPISFDKKQGHGVFKRKKGKMTSKISSECKDRKLGPVEINMIKEVYSIQNYMDKDENSHAHFLPVSVVEDKSISEIKGKPGHQGEEVKSALSSQTHQELKCKNIMEVSLDGILEDGLIKDHQEGPSNVFVEEAQSIEDTIRNSAKTTESTEKVQVSLHTGILDDLATLREHCQENGVVMLKRNLNYSIQCAFCLSSEDSEASGEMIHYYNCKPVASDYNGGSRVIHCHRYCAEWAPNVYFEDDNAINLEAELARSRRIKCCCCGLKGAALGCYEKSCRKSFHVPCAKLIRQCRWDTENFVILCPLHASYKLPNESTKSQERRKKCISKGQIPKQCNQVTFKHDINTHQSWKSRGKLVLCCSALTIGEKDIVSEFESLSGVTVLKNWDLSVTHVIASTDENGACRRTLKVLMGILKGKWIVNTEWVKACIKAMKLVEEMPYEITADIHGIRDGPRNGRLRVLNKHPNIFEGFKFYLMGDFTPPYKGYVRDLLIAGGGTILHRKPISGAQGTCLLEDTSKPPTFIIYSLEMPNRCDPSKKNTILNQRRSGAEALASSTGAKAVSNKWVLNSIAACKLHSLAQ